VKYLMTWMGVTSGTHMGRDDGYPERKNRIIDSFDELVRTYREDAEYFKLESVDVKAAVKAVKDLDL